MALAAWAFAFILLLKKRTPQAAGAEVTVHVVCHDLKTVEVTWGPASRAPVNLSLYFRYADHAHRPCPHYFLGLFGLTNGCVLPAGQGLLELQLRDGGGATVFAKRRLASAWLRPRPPWNVTVLWDEDGIAVTCPAHPYPGLDYELQLRGPGDLGWQAISASRCDLRYGGLDPRHCYDLRVRAMPRGSHYGPEAMPSAWTSVRGAGPAASCADPTTPQPLLAPPLALALGLAMLAALALLPALLWLRRVKEALLPCVPDPRSSFPGLFETHGGNFQIDITMLHPIFLPLPVPAESGPIHSDKHCKLRPLPKVNFLEQRAWIAGDTMVAAMMKGAESEEDNVIQPLAKGVETEQEAAPGSLNLPPVSAGHRATVSVGGAAFLVDDSGYLTL